jgi:hypothetical protein
MFQGYSQSLLAEFDQRRPKHYPPSMAQRTRRSLLINLEIIEAAKQRGLGLSDYISQLHINQRSSRIAYVASLYRGFALLEMARVPVDPAYFELVEGALGEEEGKNFRLRAGSGVDYALPKAAAQLLGADTRKNAVEAILLAATRAQVPHEGFIEAARLLEATYFR